MVFIKKLPLGPQGIKNPTPSGIEINIFLQLKQRIFQDWNLDKLVVSSLHIDIPNEDKQGHFY